MASVKEKRKLNRGFYLWEDQIELIRKEAKARGLSLGDMMSAILDGHVASTEKSATKRPKKMFGCYVRQQSLNKIVAASARTKKTESLIAREAVEDFFNNKKGADETKL